MGFLGGGHIASVVIAGAGGFGLEVLDYLEEHARAGGPRVAGFLDDTPDAPLPAGVAVQHLGTIDDFRPVPNQVAVVAIGTVKGRRAVLERLWRNGVHTPSFVAFSAQVSPSAVVEEGVVVCPFTIISRNATICAGAMINVHCTVAHGASVGAHSILSPYTTLNGDASVGEGCFLGTRTTIFPRVRIGDGCIVDTHAGVRADAPARQMISSRGRYMVNALRLP